jgi:hypothetical protein
MATRTFEQDFNALSDALGDRFAFVGDGLKTMGPLGRRLALTTFGAVLALGLGAATASAFRLPSEVTDPAQPQDQTLAQSELPSETAARAYALANPPVYAVAGDHADATMPTDATFITATTPEDAGATPAVSYATSDETPSSTDKTDADATSSTPTTAPTESNDAGQS